MLKIVDAPVELAGAFGFWRLLEVGLGSAEYAVDYASEDGGDDDADDGYEYPDDDGRGDGGDDPLDHETAHGSDGHVDVSYDDGLRDDRRDDVGRGG
jgi:hypothetical protein